MEAVSSYPPLVLLPLLLLACGEPPATLAGSWAGGALCEETWDFSAELSLSEQDDGSFTGGFDHIVSQTTDSDGQEVRLDIVTRAAATVWVDDDEGALDYELQAREVQCVLYIEGELQHSTCAELGIGLTEAFADLHLGVLTWDGADRIGLLDRSMGCAGELLRVVD